MKILASTGGRRQALEAEQDAGTGDDITLSEARRDVRIWHLPGHGLPIAVGRYCRCAGASAGLQNMAKGQQQCRSRLTQADPKRYSTEATRPTYARSCPTCSISLTCLNDPH